MQRFTPFERPIRYCLYVPDVVALGILTLSLEPSDGISLNSLHPDP